MESILEREASFCDGEQNETIVSSLYSQKQAMLFCDVIMKVCGKDIYAHSNVLAAASPYFSTFLTQGMPRQFSQRTPQLIEIQIDGSEPSALYEEAVTVVIDFIYTGKLTVRETNAGQIAEIARIMQMNKIVKFCDDFLSGTDSFTVNPLVPVGKGTSSHRIMVDVATNTGGAFMKAFHSSFQPEPTPKVRTKGLVSVSTQVLPQLLGLAPSIDGVETCVKATSTEGLLEHPWGTWGNVYIRDKSPDVDAELEELPPPVVHAPKRGRPRKRPYSPTLRQPAKKTKTQARASEDTEGNVGPGPVTDHCGVVHTFEIQTSNTSGDDGASGANEAVLDSSPTPDEASEVAATVQSPSPTKLQDVTPSKAKKPSKESQHASPVLPQTIKTEEPIALRRGRRSIKPTAKMSDFAGEFQSFLNPAGSQRIKQEKGDHDENVEVSAELQDEGQDMEEHLGEIDNEISHTEFLEYVMEENETRDIRHAHIAEVAAEELVEMRSAAGSKVKRRGRGRPKKEDLGCEPVRFGKYQCEVCEFTTNKVRDMGSHRKLHKLAENTCYYCDQKFDDKDVLTNHMDKHKGPKPFFCPVCSTRFKTRTQLNLHLPKHSDEKPFMCEICCQGFKWKHALKNHMITHSNRKDHLCDFCGYATAHKSQLKAHKLIHTGQTFKCAYPECTFQATKAQNMKYHLLTHSRERPHQCEVCGQNFSLVKNMKRHMLLHIAEKTHSCRNCSFASTRFDKLKEHLLKQHSIGTPPEKRLLVADLIKQDQSMMPSAHGFKREPSEEPADPGMLSLTQDQYQLVQVVSSGDGTTEEQLVTELHPVLLTNDGITNIIISQQSDGSESVQLQPQPQEGVEQDTEVSESSILHAGQVLDGCTPVEGQILSNDDGQAVIVTQADGTDYTGYTEVMMQGNQMANFVSYAEESAEPQ